MQKAAVISYQKVFLNEVEVYGKNKYVIYGFVGKGGKFYEMKETIDREALEYLLVRNLKVGTEIISRISDAGNFPHEVPITISLLDIFGMTQPFYKP